MTQQITERPVALVTGATSPGGFGEMIARRLVAAKYTTIVSGRDEPRLGFLAEELGVELEVCDMMDHDQIDAMAERVLERHPDIDVLVNNAGQPLRKGVLEAGADELEEAMATNYMGGLFLTRALMNGLRGDHHADVIDIVSAGGIITSPSSGGYGASKSAQRAASVAMAYDLSGTNIAVRTVNPGRANTKGHPQEASRSPISIATRTTPTKVAERVMGLIGRESSEIYIPRILRGVAIADVIDSRRTTKIVAKAG